MLKFPEDGEKDFLNLVDIISKDERKRFAYPTEGEGSARLKEFEKA